ncbi:MAG: non-canonical purine NTP pyrophosphatase [Leptospiraceae bacterium]|nr:non-canonical purine NTP pyrophosphatase [Leptospiraceae bacterium]
MILGTTNPHKVREIGGICAPLEIELVPVSLDILETGDTFEDNALCKAIAYSEAYPDSFVLVEDSGLLIPSLEGLPGPYSARFSDYDIASKTIHNSNLPREEMDRANNEKVLQCMEAVPEEKRGAYFVICIIIIKNTKVFFRVTQKAFGWILKDKRGDKGFGYDPIFASDTSFGKSWAEIDSTRKNLISHRGEALWDLQAWLCSEEARDIH